MKKIIFVSQKMNLGGTEKSLLSLLHALKEQPIQVTLLLIEKGGILAGQIPEHVTVKYFANYDGIKDILTDPPQNTLLSFLRSGDMLSALKYLVPFLRIKLTGNWYPNYKVALADFKNYHGYDIAVAYASPSDFISYLVAKKIAATKKIQWIHFDYEKSVKDYSFAKRFYRYFSEIYCVSVSGRDNFVKIFPEFRKKVAVFQNISNPAEIIKAAENGESFCDAFDGVKVLTVGRFTREKGYHLIPEVVQKLKKEKLNFKWYLVGDGKEKKGVMEMAEQLNVADSLVFLGAKENPYPFMRDCDVYVQPSLHEGFGITVEEAKIFNKPIVITNFASANDLIIDYETGLITEISSEAIFEAVKSLILDNNLRNKFIDKLECRGMEPAIDVSRLWEN